MAMGVFLGLFILFVSFVSQARNTDFIFHGFIASESEVILDEASIVKPNGALRLTNSTQKNVSAHAFYRHPIRMFDRNSPNASSFSTSFVFTIKTPKSGAGGHGIAFTLSPLPGFPGAEAGHYLGIFNSSNDGNASNHVLAVEFDTVNGINESSESRGNHVGINVNSIVSVASEPASYHINHSNREDVWLDSGDPIRVWIEYDGINRVNVTISRPDMEKPSTPLISHEVDLTSIVKENMYVGFSASTAEQASSHYILGWSFALNSTVAPPINVSMLPVIPNEQNSSAYQNSTIVLVSFLSSVAVLLYLAGLESS